MKRMLMPTDGSACSEAAIRQGLTLAKALGATVTFLYALEDPALPMYATPGALAYEPQLYEDLKRAAEEALARAQVLAQEAGVPCQVQLAERQHPVEAIHKAEDAHDLVVMGTHGRRGFNRFVFGSVAEGALRRAKKPYLMIRHPEDGA
ncbi:universal stress protein [Truepera radiovictrix]|uniref:UspA domain protein n=1 Tax=Truepera radiovictrix (strain DSM 17093 / CIP 108686 / LMG 22925 / RQ-24) TaxID=649638 RepID=D7CQC9_TRURR|nr:universal stress protein [Truepera radiovictrix]ADI14913.1 UspA domain protein [Truepera radiovictrix DSM 17093]WMT56535.1 universal stress protein [Truepera radiovictrix]